MKDLGKSLPRFPLLQQSFTQKEGIPCFDFLA